MDNSKLNSVLGSAASGDGNVQEKVEQATGTYKDSVADASPEAKSIYSSLPKAPDPSPFALGSLGSK